MRAAAPRIMLRAPRPFSAERTASAFRSDAPPNLSKSSFPFRPVSGRGAGRGGEPRQAGRELLLPRDLERASPAQEHVGDLPEVLHVRTDDRRNAVPRRLQDIVPALRDEAAADEGEIGRGVRARELSDRVEQQDRLRRSAPSPRESTSAARAEMPSWRSEGLDGAEPLRVPRGEEEPDRRVDPPGRRRTPAAASPPPLRAWTRRRSSGLPPPSPAPGSSGQRRRALLGGDTSNFRFPPTVTIPRVGPQGDEPVRILPRSARRSPEASGARGRRTTGTANTRRTTARRAAR